MAEASARDEFASARDTKVARDIFWEFGGIADQVWAERRRQLSKWGLQTRDDGTSTLWGPIRDMLRETCDEKTAAGVVTWFDILMEEVYEAISEEDGEALETELIQCMAVIAQWLQDRKLKREAALTAAA